MIEDIRPVVERLRDGGNFTFAEIIAALDSAYARIAELEGDVREEEIATQEAVGLMSEELAAAVHAAHIAGMMEAAGIAEAWRGSPALMKTVETFRDSPLSINAASMVKREARDIASAIRLAANSKGEKG